MFYNLVILMLEVNWNGIVDIIDATISQDHEKRGVGTLFSLISSRAFNTLKLQPQFAHLDSTNFRDNRAQRGD